MVGCASRLRSMKMNTMNISLTPEQSEYVRRTVERDFGNARQYLRELIRERMRRQIEADLVSRPCPPGRSRASRQAPQPGSKGRSLPGRGADGASESDCQLRSRFAGPGEVVRHPDRQTRKVSSDGLTERFPASGAFND